MSGIPYEIIYFFLKFILWKRASQMKCQEWVTDVHTYWYLQPYGCYGEQNSSNPLADLWPMTILI